MVNRVQNQSRILVVVLVSAAAAACSDSKGTGPGNTPETIVLTTGQVASLKSAGQTIANSNPSDPDLKALLDSTLGVLTAGVEARRLDVTTDLTTAPLYFVGLHRTASYPNTAWSTWTLVGFDDPSHLTALVEVSGFAQVANATPPSTVTGTIGDGTGIVNALMIQVGSGGTVTKWNAGTGTASFRSDAAGAACPNFTPPNSHISCAVETEHLQFTANAASGSGGAGARQTSLSTESSVSAMRLIYTP